MSLAVNTTMQFSPLAASVLAAPPQVRSAIADAAQRGNVSFDFLLAQARMESGLDPSARAKTSSAAGLFQFIDSTWLSTVQKHGGAAEGMSREQVLAMRYDPHMAAQMAAALASDNKAGLRATLGREPDHAELYIAHFLGLGGAQKLLSADPSASAAALFPQAAKANRAIFYDNGEARSVGEVLGVIRDRMAAAKAQGDGGYPEVSPSRRAFAPYASTVLAQPAGAPDAPDAPRRASMAETLRSAFAGSEHTLAPAAHHRVARAYSRLNALGL